MTVQEFYDWALENDKWSYDLYEVFDQMEQSPFIVVLNKIRAEIEREIIPRNSDQYDYEAKWQNSGLRMALKIIDKYKAESEE